MQAGKFFSSPASTGFQQLWILRDQQGHNEHMSAGTHAHTCTHTGTQAHQA